MRKFITCLLLCAFGFAGAQDIPPRPDPPRLVNDFTGTLSADEQSALEQKLVAYNDSTSTQIAIVMIRTLDGYPIEDYSFALGEKWGVGQKGKNNGLVVMIALDDHKIFIATGYGMEGALPDGMLKRIIETDIKPAFREGRYYDGLQQATDDIIRLAAGEYTAEPVEENEPPFGIILGLFLLIFFVVMMLKTREVKTYARVNNIPFWTAWLLLNQARRVHRGSWGGFSGGGSWGGGSSGGGFGGFGGGSFGGGGAGGSW